MQAVPEKQRTAVLGRGWKSSGDLAWQLSGDADGLHVQTAAEADGYAWRTTATLAEPGIETDLWIGNACVTGSGDRAVVAYAPRTFTNRGVLFDRGAFAAVVDLRTGSVRKLRARVSLAYFNPSCGTGEEAVLTQAGDQDLGRTRLLRLNAATGAVTSKIEVPGQLTSAVPTPGGIVAADAGAVVRVEASGKRRILARTSSVPFRLAADADGGVVYLEQTGKDTTVARRLGRDGGTPATLTTGALSKLDVTSGRGGRVYVTGAATKAEAGTVTLLDAPAGTRVSTEGALAVTGVSADRKEVSARALRTGRTVTLSAVTTAKPEASRDLSPALLGDSTNPADFAERYCSVPRNDPKNQAMQPKPRQVEWAVDQAVRNVLTVYRPDNWKNLGMPAYTPQGMFPPIPLSGGGNVPAQVMLGIAAQESNLWQAARFAVPGVTANPLIGNYYGVDIYNGTEADDWTIRWDKADCGYGVTQVTDGMRLAGREKPGETALPHHQQRAVALDFAANIAAGLRILQSKWNQTRDAGLVLNNGDPSKIENWFYAVWAYNSGFYPESQAAANNGAWGVGWANNPANPKYPANRGSFLETDDYKDDYADAARPQLWPYPEKVMGWAGHPVEVLEAPDTLVIGYRAAWWNGGAVNGPINRHHVRPPQDMFCDFSNNCEFGSTWLPDAPEVIGEPAGPCNHRNSSGKIDLKCWYHKAVGWKVDCALTCGNELVRFDPGYAYQEDGTAYPPSCDLTGLPSGSRVIDNLPNQTPSVRPNCYLSAGNNGDLKFDYITDSHGQYPGKIDTHQLGMGLGGHFWMTNSRQRTAPDGLVFSGTWRFNQAYQGVGRVWVHLPHLHNGTTYAQYAVGTGYGDRIRTISQKGTGNRWVSLGVFPFDGTPQVRLTNVSPTGDGSQRVAFDAVALQPLTSVRTVSTLSWNLAGAAQNDGDFYVVDRLMAEVTQRRPDVLLLNEICDGQFDNLSAKLAQSGWQMHGNFQVTGSGTNPTCFNESGGDLAEGIAVFVRGTVTGTQNYRFRLDNRLVLTPSTEDLGTRGVACSIVRFSTADKDAKVCVTHLETGYPANMSAAYQAQELARVFGPEARQKPFILGGDTNIDTLPANDHIGAVYSEPLGTGEFNEVEQARACIVAKPCEELQGGTDTFLGGGPDAEQKKLDYVFADRWHFAIPVGRVVVNENVGLCGEQRNKPCSDHKLIYSELYLPAG
ncbi:hypothetical protein Ari01nite_80990 [Paractinoplanes rishiriensis]|uniref:Endonuclease/exonuclease/phosphatase domain-containing protein n=1 Tax=Paractinoplanes rishiriensis TaxID=1050105 RepID=A0A919K6N4_9ACTN|nr:hypothetical protein Ari01nite_80990 [Actinoplanes rishiriensis]